jgi:hypothetical protein
MSGHSNNINDIAGSFPLTDNYQVYDPGKNLSLSVSFRAYPSMRIRTQSP